MISRKNRFRGHRSLDYTYKNGRSVRSGSLSLKYVPARGEDYRLAVVVSKKVSKSAVRRNRIRRRIFEYFRKLQAEQARPLKYDLIITVFKEDVATMESAELYETVDKLLRNARIVIK